MPDDIKKITVEASDPFLQPRMHKKSLPKGVIVVPVAIVIVLAGLALVLFLLMRGVIAKGRDVVASARVVGDAFKSQDLDKAKVALSDTQQKIDALSAEYSKIRPFGYIPILGSYVSDGDHAIKAATAGVLAGQKAVEALEPNADILGLKGKNKFVQGSADDRIQTAVKTMSALTPKVNEMATYVDTLRKEIDYIDPNRYPTKVGNLVIRDQLASARDVIDNAANLFVNAQPLLMNLPKMLGEPSPKTYLVLFQNDKELRSTGGFMTAYAIFRITRGKMTLVRSDDIYTLDNALRKKYEVPREILTFHKGVYTFNLRDSNLSPDFKVSMMQFEDMYNNVSGHEPIDGIWAVDTHVLVEALRILGPITIHDADFNKDRVFSAETDKRCDCPRAVYELEDSSTRPVGYVRAERKAVLGDLLQLTVQKALGVSPSQYWGKLFQMFLSEISKKHVVAYFHDNDAQKASESFNLAGRIMAASETATLLKYKEGEGWDYLHINNSNMAGAKSNMFTSQSYTKDVSVNSDGTITTKLTLSYKNPYPGSDCGLESGGLCLNAPLRDWIRIYAPVGSKLTDSKGAISPKDGKPVPLDSYDSLGKTVFEGFLIVNPLGTAEITLTYTSPFKSSDGKYRLLMQKQPGTEGDQVTLKMGGRDRKKFTLDTDTELVL